LPIEKKRCPTNLHESIAILSFYYSRRFVDNLFNLSPGALLADLIDT